MLQALVRGYLGRLRCDRLRLERHKAWVATVVQSLVRRCMAIKLVTRLRKEAMRKHLCATAVQCMYRCWKARRRVDERRAEVLHILRTKAAIELQRVWRGILGRRRAKRIREQARILRARQQGAAIHIQRVYKGRAPHSGLFLIIYDAFHMQSCVSPSRFSGATRGSQLADTEDQGEAEEASGYALFAASRSRPFQQVSVYLVAPLHALLHLLHVDSRLCCCGIRVRTCRLRAERDRMARLRLSCAVKLERMYRGHLGRRRVATLRQQQANKQRVVLWVQKHWRGYAARQDFESLLQVHSGVRLALCVI